MVLPPIYRRVSLVVTTALVACSSPTAPGDAGTNPNDSGRPAASALQSGITAASVSSTTITGTLTNATAGSLIVVGLAGTGVAPSFFSDSAGNGYSSVVNVSSGTLYSAMFYAPNAKAGTVTLTGMFAGSATGATLVWAEYAGIQTQLGNVDNVTGGDGMDTVLDCPSLTTTNANDLLVAMAFGPTGTWTTSPGFANELAAVAAPAALEDQTLASKGTFGESLAHSVAGNAVCLVVAFKSR